MSITPSQVLSARVIPPVSGQLDLFGVEDGPEPTCPPDCPCHSMTPQHSPTDDCPTCDPIRSTDERTGR